MFRTDKKQGFVLNEYLLCIVMIGCLFNNCLAQPQVVKQEAMVQRFYKLHQRPLYWFLSDQNITRATDWLTMIASADHYGITLDKLQSDQIRVALLSNHNLDNRCKEIRDRQITGLILNFIKEIQEGDAKFDYDEVHVPRDSVYISLLLNSKSTEPVSQIVSEIDCQDHSYQVLKQFLNDSIAAKDTLKYKKVVWAMNYLRYLAANQTTESIVANIPAAEATYYQNGFPKLQMRTVVGRKSNPTPTIASYIRNIVTFPRWNVPHSIAVKEILPKVLKEESYLEQNNFDVVDASGNVIDDSEFAWKKYNKNNFPYFFRQATGSRNSLGVVKFNFQSPFSIYLHSTNLQGAFARDIRFLSHGCIRLEKSFELAKYLLPDKIDTEELKRGKKDTESKTLKLPRKIPVFIIYMPVTVQGNKVIFLPDIYGLIK
jgi:murein L,D-transpeptidase YcbB/YkuD